MAAERIPGGFGGRLREARERRGTTLRQIAEATKISVSALDALERNDISRLPGGIFGRAFVRSYAVEVGLDPEATIQEFIAQFPQASVTVGHPTSEQVEDNEALESDRRMASTSLRLAALSLPLVGLVLYFGVAGRRTGEPVSPDAAVATAAAEPAPAFALGAPGPDAGGAAASGVAPVQGPAAPQPAPTSGEPETDRLTVTLVATGPCWVSATVDGQQVLGRQLQPGDREQIEVRTELIVTSGDAAALSMTFNGAPTLPLGGPGQVVTRRVTLANFKDYLAPR